MKRKILVDAGPLYALADPSDQYHEQASTLLPSMLNEHYSLVVAYSTALETHALIQRNLGVIFAQTWLNALLVCSNLVNPRAEDYGAASQKLARFADQTISLFDATLAVLSERLNMPVWTFDSDFDVMRVNVWR